MGLSHKTINWIIVGVVLFLIVLGIVLGVTLGGKNKSPPRSSYTPPPRTTYPVGSIGSTTKVPSTTTPPEVVWLAWGGERKNKNSDALSYVFRYSDKDKCSWDPRAPIDFSGASGKDFDKSHGGWQADGGVCPKNDTDSKSTVPVCAAASFYSDGTKYDCGYQTTTDKYNRGDSAYVAANLEDRLNSLQDGDSVGVIKDDGSCKIITNASDYKWEAQSENTQYRDKKTNCPYSKSGDLAGKSYHQYVMFMPVKGTKRDK